MINTELLNYIKEQASLGLSRAQIKKALLNAGWQEEDVDEGFTALIDAEQLPDSMHFERTEGRTGLIKRITIATGVVLVVTLLVWLLWRFAELRLI